MAALQARLVAFDGQQVVRFPFPADVLGGVVLGVCGVGGHHGIRQVYRVQQLFDLRDLVGVVGDAVLGNDHLLLVQHRGEQLDLPVRHAAQPLAVDRDRGQQALQPSGGGQRAQPVPDDLIQRLRVQHMQQGADPLLARRDDPAPQRVRPPAERGQQLLRHVSSLVPDLPEALRPGQHADHRHCQREHQAEPPATHLARIRDPGEDAQQAGNLLISAGQGSYTGMRNWHRWPLVPELIWRDTLIISDRGHPCESGNPSVPAARSYRAQPATANRTSSH